LARWLLTEEASASEGIEATVHAALYILERLRLSLSERVGVAGYNALLKRALALAKAEMTWLGVVQVQADGTLDGFAETTLAQEKDEAARGIIALLAQLLGLLITIIGEALALRLVQNVWPKVRLEDLSSGRGETPA
jgi:hypothetical protein